MSDKRTREQWKEVETCGYNEKMVNITRAWYGSSVNGNEDKIEWFTNIYITKWCNSEQWFWLMYTESSPKNAIESEGVSDTLKIRCN